MAKSKQRKQARRWLKQWDMWVELENIKWRIRYGYGDFKLKYHVGSRG